MTFYFNLIFYNYFWSWRSTIYVNVLTVNWFSNQFGLQTFHNHIMIGNTMCCMGSCCNVRTGCSMVSVGSLELGSDTTRMHDRLIVELFYFYILVSIMNTVQELLQSFELRLHYVDLVIVIHKRNWKVCMLETFGCLYCKIKIPYKKSRIFSRLKLNFAKKIGAKNQLLEMSKSRKLPEMLRCFANFQILVCFNNNLMFPKLTLLFAMWF